MPRIFFNKGTSDIFRGSSIGKIALETSSRVKMTAGVEKETDIIVSPEEGITLTFSEASDSEVTGTLHETVPTLELFGYLIEKQRRTIARRGGSLTWTDCPTQYVSNASFAGFKDLSVAYGRTYRYRVRSIWKSITSREGEFGAEYESLKQRLISKIPQCKAIIDIFVQPYTSAYYKSNPTDWVAVTILDDKPPVSSDILVKPDSHKRTIIVTWICPPDSQRDIDYYYVWKKQRDIEGTWPKEWTKAYKAKNNIDNYFVDFDVGFSKEYLYAVQVVDKHGFESKLSAQVIAKLNKTFYYDGFEYSTRLFQWPNKTLEESSKTVVNRDILFCQHNFKIKTKPQFTESEKKFYIRITSMDTGQKVIIPLTIKNMPLILEEGTET